MQAPLVSVVIPVWRDVVLVRRAVDSAAVDGVEIVVSAAWEDADAVASARRAVDGVRWVFARRGRGNQMNAGAAAAQGEWLLFLHADSVLPRSWLHDIRAAAAEGFAAGCFRFGIDASGWRPRLWEQLVWLRVRYFDLPYGDQGLFVRRDLFQAAGGYRDIPLMEDVELVRELCRRTRLFKAQSVVTTSPRRWERDGWLRRSVTNLTLLARYRLGVDARRLARTYFGTSDTVVAVMARAPSSAGKTRLGRSMPALRRALLLDTWDVVAPGPWTAALVFTPPDAAEECAALVRANRRLPLLLPQAGDTLGERMSMAFRELFAAGYLHVILVGSDVPTLPPERLDDAVAALRRGADLVLGPADDGGYYLIGLSGLHEALFSDVRWGGPDVFGETIARARSLGQRVHVLGAWYDVDSPADLARLAQEPGGRGLRTRRILRAENLDRPEA